MPILDPNEINNTIFEPILQHRFIVYVDTIPAYLIKKIDGIGFDDGEVIIDHINTYTKHRAKRRWNDVTLSLYNPVAPSAAQAVQEWARLGYEAVTGRSGYYDFYTKGLTFNAIDPVGSIVTEWKIKGCYVKNALFGQWDWSADAYTTIDLTLGVSSDILNY